MHCAQYFLFSPYAFSRKLMYRFDNCRPAIVLLCCLDRKNNNIDFLHFFYCLSLALLYYCTLSKIHCTYFPLTRCHNKTLWWVSTKTSKSLCRWNYYHLFDGVLAEFMANFYTVNFQLMIRWLFCVCHASVMDIVYIQGTQEVFGIFLFGGFCFSRIYKQRAQCSKKSC